MTNERNTDITNTRDNERKTDTHGLNEEIHNERTQQITTERTNDIHKLYIKKERNK